MRSRELYRHTQATLIFCFFVPVFSVFALLLDLTVYYPSIEHLVNAGIYSISISATYISLLHVVDVPFPQTPHLSTVLHIAALVTLSLGIAMLATGSLIKWFGDCPIPSALPGFNSCEYRRQFRVEVFFVGLPITFLVASLFWKIAFNLRQSS